MQGQLGPRRLTWAHSPAIPLHTDGKGIRGSHQGTALNAAINLYNPIRYPCSQGCDWCLTLPQWPEKWFFSYWSYPEAFWQTGSCCCSHNSIPLLPIRGRPRLAVSASSLRPAAWHGCAVGCAPLRWWSSLAFRNQLLGFFRQGKKNIKRCSSSPCPWLSLQGHSLMTMAFPHMAAC